MNEIMSQMSQDRLPEGQQQRERRSGCQGLAEGDHVVKAPILLAQVQGKCSRACLPLNSTARHPRVLGCFCPHSCVVLFLERSQTRPPPQTSSAPDGARAEWLRGKHSRLFSLLSRSVSGLLSLGACPLFALPSPVPTRPTFSISFPHSQQRMSCVPWSKLPHSRRGGAWDLEVCSGTQSHLVQS
jgi:hypothetical protein